MSGARKPEGDLQRAMRAGGSLRGNVPVWDGWPTQQTDFTTRKGIDEPVRRLQGWMETHSYRNRCHYAVVKSRDGRIVKELGRKHFSQDLGWDTSYGGRVWDEAERYGVVRKDPDHPGRLYMCGKVNAGERRAKVRQERPTVTPLPSDNVEDCTKDSRLPPPKVALPSVDDLPLPSPEIPKEDFELAKSTYLRTDYIRRAYTQKDRGAQAKTVKRMAVHARWRSRGIADVMAATREVYDGFDDDMLAEELEIERRSLPKQRERAPWVEVTIKILVEPGGQLSLFDEPEPEPAPVAAAAPAAPAKPAIAPDPPVKTPVAKPMEHAATAAQAAPVSQEPMEREAPASTPEVEQVFQGIRRYGCSRTVARDLVRRCRQADPHSTAAQILHAVEVRDADILNAKTSKPGLMLKFIPEMFEGGYHAPDQAPRKKSRAERFAEEIKAERRKAGGET